MLWADKCIHWFIFLQKKKKAYDGLPNSYQLTKGC